MPYFVKLHVLDIKNYCSYFFLAHIKKNITTTADLRIRKKTYEKRVAHHLHAQESLYKSYPTIQKEFEKVLNNLQLTWSERNILIQEFFRDNLYKVPNINPSFILYNPLIYTIDNQIMPSKMNYHPITSFCIESVENTQVMLAESIYNSGNTCRENYLNHPYRSPIIVGFIRKMIMENTAINFSQCYFFFNFYHNIVLFFIKYLRNYLRTYIVTIDKMRINFMFFYILNTILIILWFFVNNIIIEHIFLIINCIVIFIWILLFINHNVPLLFHETLLEISYLKFIDHYTIEEKILFLKQYFILKSQHLNINNELYLLKIFKNIPFYDLLQNSTINEIKNYIDNLIQTYEKLENDIYPLLKDHIQNEFNNNKQKIDFMDKMYLHYRMVLSYLLKNT